MVSAMLSYLLKYSALYTHTNFRGWDVHFYVLSRQPFSKQLYSPLSLVESLTLSTCWILHEIGICLKPSDYSELKRFFEYETKIR